MIPVHDHLLFQVNQQGYLPDGEKVLRNHHFLRCPECIVLLPIIPSAVLCVL